ncbi:deoxyguanosinetriphosphate triphosphohydrolase [Pilimelia columellifera]|uniref:Deoxyguanosinetriphosphate triphosphohydrolase n=1 Tax=Pilimelia columellifera subsp. columellifera TaxID=706583 RepID=A0ABN3N506_9ACTN
MSDAAPDERWSPEPAKETGQDRSPFERDRARVLHCAAFRRLATKTQVHTAGSGPAHPGPGGSGDFLRTRLTHSLEVAQIARQTGESLGCDPDVVDVAGLAHDLGHPPFGHNGEDALNVVAAGCGGFEGNAQTLRVLVRLEAKVLRPDDRSAGLNLTRASLDAVCKYPWPRRAGQRKFGVYADDLEIFGWLRAAAPVDDPDRRCLEAQVMDWSDDVAYSVHDVEDGIYGDHVPVALLLADADERAQLCADVARVHSDEPLDYLSEQLTALLADPVLAALAGYDRSHRAQVALKWATSVLTGRFSAAAVLATRERYGAGPLRHYDADLIVPRQVRAQVALLKGLALRYVLRRRGAEPGYQRQREILIELTHALTLRAPAGLDPVFAPLWRAAPDDAARLRVVVDQVASLTDPAAVAWHHHLAS